VVDAESGDSENKSRDGKMKKDILETQKYPEIIFTAQKVKGTIAAQGKSQVELDGVMTLHGQPHPMELTVPVEVNGGTVSADVPFEVPYVKWGLKNPSTFILRVSDKVQITVHMVGKFAEAAALAAAARPPAPALPTRACGMRPGRRSLLWDRSQCLRPFNDVLGVIGRHGFAIGTIAGERIVNVGDGDDASFERNVFAPGWVIAAAVEFVVMRKDDGQDLAQRPAYWLKEVNADLNMPLHLLEFVFGEARRFVKDLAADVELANVMQ